MGTDQLLDLKKWTNARTKPRPIAAACVGLAALLAVGWLLLGPSLRPWTSYRETTCAITRSWLDSSSQTFSWEENEHSRAQEYELYAPRVSFSTTAEGRSFECTGHDLLAGAQPCTPMLSAESAGPKAASTIQTSALDRDLLRRWLAIPAAYDRERAEGLLAGFEPGQTRTCWYDPRSLGQTVLLRRFEWFHWLAALIVALGVVSVLADLYQS